MNERFVLDSSLALSWCFENEVTEATQAVFASLATGATAYVPAFWAWEIGNILSMAERNKRHTPEVCQQKLALFQALPIQLDEFAHKQVWGETLRLAREHKLTTYDAAYLEMAVRFNLPLGTLDSSLRAAATKAGIACLPEKI